MRSTLAGAQRRLVKVKGEGTHHNLNNNQLTKVILLLDTRGLCIDIPRFSNDPFYGSLAFPFRYPKITTRKTGHKTVLFLCRKEISLAFVPMKTA